MGEIQAQLERRRLHQASLTEQIAVHAGRTCEGARMGCRSATAISSAARLKDYNGFVRGNTACHVEKTPSVTQPLDVQTDRLGLRVIRAVFQKIHHADISLVASMQKLAKAAARTDLTGS